MSEPCAPADQHIPNLSDDGPLSEASATEKTPSFTHYTSEDPHNLL